MKIVHEALVKIDKYLGILAISANRFLAYRSDLVIRLLSNIIGCFIHYYVLKAVFKEQVNLGGLGLTSTTTYVVLVWSLKAVVRSNLDIVIGHKVNQGAIVHDLIRPVSFQLYQYVQALSGFIPTLLSVSVPSFAVLALFLPVSFERNVVAIILACVCIVLSTLLSVSICYLFGLLAFYFTRNFGFVLVKNLVVDVFSGAVIPITLFSPFFRCLSDFLPFKYIFTTPIMILIGQYQLNGIMREMGMQLLWIMVLYLIGHVWTKHAMKKIALFGG